MASRIRLWCAGLLAILVAAPIAAAPLDSARILAQRFGNDAAWYRDNIPLFESSDPKLDAVYYYRWSVLRAHQRDLGAKGYITTEFLDDVGWQREPYASLNDATGFHLYEARWLRDRRYADDYINYLQDDGGNDRHFSESIADAVWARYLVDGDRAAATRHLPTLRHVYGLWDDHFDFTKGLYWIEPLLDATEYTIASIDASGGKDGFTGGQAFRPSINSYMFANARAIGAIAALAGDQPTAELFEARAATLRQHVLDGLWSDKLGHFIDHYRVHNEHVRYWDPIRGRELVGYLPWTFGLVTGEAPQLRAWRHLLSDKGFAGAAGLRTVEPSYEYYMRQYRYDKPTGARECQWNGPVWPFQTTQVLTGLARLLHAGPQAVIGRADYLRLLSQYAAMHYQGERLDIEEDYDPQTGRPIVGLARSHHYFHSGFDDLVIGGLAGIVPGAGDTLVVDPLIDRSDPARLRYFALQDLPYRGHLLTLVYDEDGSRYSLGAGISLFVDGAKIAARPDLGRLTATIETRASAPITRPIDRAVNLVRSEYPKPSASSGSDVEGLHDAIDGRVWFFPELVNGWSSAAGRTEEWLAVDLGQPATLSSAELAFYVGAEFQLPGSYALQYQVDGRWRDLPGARLEPALANGVTRASFAPVTASRIRVLMRKPAATRLRVVELKLF